MSEAVSTTGVAAPATENKTKKTRSPINQAFARDLTRAQSVGLAAQNADYAPALGNRDIDEDFVNELLSGVDAARSKAGDAVVNTTAHRNATAAEDAAGHALQAGLQEAQKAAKQKYARTNRIALADYFIGKKLNGSRPNLMQTSQTIITRLGADKLPGFTTVKVRNLGVQRQAWVDAQSKRADAETAARSSRAELKTLVKSVKDRKIAVQLAADAEWPHTDAENAGIRREFALSPRSPLNV